MPAHSPASRCPHVYRGRNSRARSLLTPHTRCATDASHTERTCTCVPAVLGRASHPDVTSSPKATAEESGASPERSRHCDSGSWSLSNRPGKSGRLPWLAAVASRVRRPEPACRGRGYPQEGCEVRTFPFSAVVGSHDMALALILTTVSPEVGGVLVRGEKGTAKTTMVRALAHVLPDISVVPGSLKK